MDRRTQIIIATAFGIFLISVIIRLPTIDAPFIYDDFHASVRNPAVTGQTKLFKIFTDPSAFSSRPGKRMYRPVTLLSYVLSYRISGSNPRGWHLFSIIIHGICALLVFGIALRLFSGKISTGATAALLWAMHPLVGEAIVYQAARSSLLVGTAVILGVYSYLSLKNHLGRAVAVSACMLVGLACKETAVVLPAIILLCDIARKENPFNNWRTYAASGAVLVFYLIFRKTSLGVETFIITQPVRSLESNIMTQATVVTAYMSRALWPMRLSIEWDWPVFHSLWSRGISWWQNPLLNIFGIVGLITAGILCIRRHAIFTLGAGWFLVALVPESSIIPLVQVAAERRLYLPMVGLAIAAAYLIQRASLKKPAFGHFAFLIILLFSIITFADSRKWRSAEKLWESALIEYPSSRVALHSLASFRLESNRLESSETLYRRLLEKHPDYSGGYLGMGRILTRKGRLDEAAELYLFAMKIVKNNEAPWINLTLIYLRQKKFEEAENTARKGLELFPESSGLWNNLGTTLARQGRFQEAVDALNRALEIDPQYTLASQNRDLALKDLEKSKKHNIP